MVDEALEQAWAEYNRMAPRRLSIVPTRFDYFAAGFSAGRENEKEAKGDA
jgi:hypothetical protein